MNQSIILTVALFLVGLVLIIKGGDWFVDAASWMARASGIPAFLIGATIVSVATTLPELIVSVMAAAEGSVDMAVGNAVGSVTANTSMIMALSLIFMPVAVERKTFSRKACLMILAVALLTAFCLSGVLSLWEGLILLGVFLVFIWENVRSAKTLSSPDEPREKKEKIQRKELLKNLFFFLLGAAALVVGSRLLVNNGTILAELLGVPERVIAVTMVAIGTSLPELVTAITAIAKKESSLSVGNILGANIIDLTLILPICSIICGGNLPVTTEGTPTKALIDLCVCLTAVLIATIPTIIRKKFSRAQGISMLCLYAVYLVYTFVI